MTQGVADANEEAYLQSICNLQRVQDDAALGDSPLWFGEWGLPTQFAATDEFLYKWADAQKLAYSQGKGWIVSVQVSFLYLFRLSSSLPCCILVLLHLSALRARREGGWSVDERTRTLTLSLLPLQFWNFKTEISALAGDLSRQWSYLDGVKRGYLTKDPSAYNNASVCEPYVTTSSSS